MSEPMLDTAVEIARWLHHSDGVNVRMINQWARRGRITRHPGNLYDAMEIVRYLEELRDTRMLDVRSGIKTAR